MVNHYIPHRGDLVWLDFDPILGHEQGGRRPALVLSSRVYNKIGLALICPITSQVKGYPFEVFISVKVSRAILCDHVRNLDWTQRHVEFIQTVPEPLMNKVQVLLQKLILNR
jgi:mRNA interferase MazF